MNSQARDIHVASQRLGQMQESPKASKNRLSLDSSQKYLLNNQSSKMMTQSPSSKNALQNQPSKAKHLQFAQNNKLGQ